MFGQFPEIGRCSVNVSRVHKSVASRHRRWSVFHTKVTEWNNSINCNTYLTYSHAKILFLAAVANRKPLSRARLIGLMFYFIDAQRPNYQLITTYKYDTSARMRFNMEVLFVNKCARTDFWPPAPENDFYKGRL